MGNFFSELWSVICTTVSDISFFDIVDIACVSFLIYTLFKFMKNTRAVQLIRGIVIVIAILLVSKILNLVATEYIINSCLEFGILAVLIIFQPELRSMLERMGRKRFNNFIFSSDDKEQAGGVNEMIENVTKAASYFSATKTGALIIFERETKLGDIMKNGKSITLDCDTSPELIMNIFFNKAPLHDGAMVIRGDRIIAAGCVLPLSASQLDVDLGTRHRAGVGVTEVSDAVSLIVSEETGIISIAVDGNLTRRLTPDVLPETLKKLLTKKEVSKKEILTGLLKGRNVKK